MKNLIELDYDAKDCYDAIKRSGKILYDNGYIEERYIDAMVDIFNEYGPYIVITKGIAMPHARPEEGALKPGFSILRLKEPVEFGSKANDPVKLIIGLSSTNNSEHLDVIQQVSELCETDENMKILMKGREKDIKSLIDAIGGDL